MKNYFHLLYLFVVLLPFASSAQTESDPAPKTYKNHVGINTTFVENLLWGDKYAPVPLRVMYKRQTHKKGAWRVELGAYYKSKDTSGYQLPGINVKTTVLSLQIGYERQHWLTKSHKLMAYYGIDAQFHSYHQRGEGDYTFATSETYIHIFAPDEKNIYRGYIKRNWQSWVLKPFVGLRWQVLQRCYLSYEFSLYASRRQWSGLNEFEEFVEKKNMGKASSWGNFLSYPIRFALYTGLNLFYLF